MLYRYELYCGGEYQGIGFLLGLKDTFSGRTADRLAVLFDKMPAPDYSRLGEKHTCSFFTELGNREFAQAIQKTVKKYKATIFETKCLEIEEDAVKGSILYSDPYQVIIKESAVQQIREQEAQST